MSESTSLTPAARAEYQQTASHIGMSLVGFESDWWGENLLGEWVDQVWAVVDEQSEDAFHLAVACTGDPDVEIRPFDDKWHFDEWVPKSKSDVLVRPDWKTFEGDDQRKGTVYAALKKHNKYGWKVCLWGDTYECLSGDEANALDGHWDDLHHTFDGDNWTIDEINGIVISKVNAAGYDLKLSEAIDT